MVTLEILKERSELIQQIEKLRTMILSTTIPLGIIFELNLKLNEMSDLINIGYSNKEESVKNVGNL